MSFKRKAVRDVFLASMIFALVAGLNTTGLAQTCAGDCDGDRSVAVSELVMGIGAALGARAIEDCDAVDGNRDRRASIEELLSAVTDHLTECTRTVIGQCMRAGPRGLEPCPQGQMVTVSQCTDQQRCLLGKGGLVVLGFGPIAAQGRFELSIHARDVDKPLLFEVEVESGTKYRTLNFGPIAEGGGAGLEVDVLIDPVSEAAVRLIADNGFENFTAEEVAEVADAVRAANANTDFTVANAEEGALLATQVARVNPDVIAAIERAIEPPFSLGLRQITAGDLRAANRSFREAVENGSSDSNVSVALSEPTLQRANAFYSVTRIVALVLDNPRLVELRERSGVQVTGDSRQLCDIIINLPMINDAIDELPADAPTTDEIVRILRNVLLPELIAASGNLANIPSDFVLNLNLTDLPECIRPTTDDVTLEIDYSDLLFLDAVLHAASAGFDLGKAYDLDTQLRPLFLAKVQEVFTLEPDLFTLRSAVPLSPARITLESVLTELGAVLDTIRAETDDQSDDFLTIAPSNDGRADIVATSLDLLRMSFTAAVTLPTTLGLVEPGRLDLRPFFEGQLAALKPFFPRFDDAGDFLCSTCFNDPTFGGMLPDVQCEDPTLMCSEIVQGAKGIDRNYRRLVSPGECAPCTIDEDCAGAFRRGDLECFECTSNCTGETMRCSLPFTTLQCDDGSF